MANTDTQRPIEIEQMQNRIDWLDSERLKTGKRMVQLEQKLTSMERNLETRDQRIRELEEKLASANFQINRSAQYDVELKMIKDEMVKLIEQYDRRRTQDQQELEKLRRIEHEMHQKDIAAIQKELTPISRIEKEVDLRRSEDERLGTIIGRQVNILNSLQSEVDKWQQELQFVEELERKNAASIASVNANGLELTKKIEALESRFDITNHGLMKAQTGLQEIGDSITTLNLQAKSWSDQIQIGEHRRDKRLDDWQRALDEYKIQMERYAAEWLKYAERYKESKLAVQTMIDWQKQVEQQQRESAELIRVETKQMRSRWDSFLLEDTKRWKNYDIDREQRWANADRREKQILEQVQGLSELIEQIQQDKDTLWRVQTAQAEAMKKWPRIWLEEVEKAKEHNPNSRRQPALVPVREE